MPPRREHKWILNGKIPEPCSNLLRWARWYETADRHIGRTELADGEVLVSTIFLGLKCGTDKRPLFFETMVFTPDHEDIGSWRYATWAEAEEGHAKVVAMMELRIAEAKEAASKAGRVGSGQ